VGPADEDGALLETWAVLAPTEDDDGRWSGSFTRTETEAGSWQLRAVAEAGGGVGSTPPRRFRAAAPPSEAEEQAAVDAADAADAAWLAAGGAEDPEAGRDAAVQALLAEPAVLSVSTFADQPGAAWIVAPGIGWVLMGNPDGSLGGAPIARVPDPHRLEAPSSGRGAPSGFTCSTRGCAGRKPPPAERSSGLFSLPSNTFWANGPYTDQFGTTEESAAVSGLVDGMRCPHWEWKVARSVVTSAVPLAAFRAQFSASIQVTSSHGDTYGYDPVDAAKMWGTSSPMAGPVVFTREMVNGPLPVNLAALASDGQIVVGTVPNMPGPNNRAVAYRPKYVRSQTAGRRMPGSIVLVSACSSAQNTALSDAYLSAGASWFGGYDGLVSTTYAAVRSFTFWQEILAQKSTGEAFTAMTTPAVADTLAGAVPKSYGRTDAVLSNGPLQNPGFSTVGDAGWVFDPNVPTNGGFSAVPDGGTWPTTGSAAWGKVPFGTSTAMRWKQPFCPLPGQEVSFGFDWSISIDPYLGFSTPQDNRFLLRVDADPDEATLQPEIAVAWNVGWTEYSPLLPATGGDMRTTGWQVAVTDPVEAPATITQDNGWLVFMMFGYDADSMIGLTDNVSAGFE
jgi:hypothetical protein